MASETKDEGQQSRSDRTSLPQAFLVARTQNQDTKVRLLGDPGLYLQAKEIDLGAESQNGGQEWESEKAALLQALAEFRRTHGFGRAISAPQIGISKRFIAMHLNKNEPSFVVINPRVTWESQETMTLWDDCMSLPDLMVRVRRAKSISVAWTDAAGGAHHWEVLDPALSELFQHEIDHLDGKLMIDRAENLHSDLISRQLYEANKAHFDSLVDYFIVPTL